MNQNNSTQTAAPPRLYTEQETFDLISNSYNVATRNHLADILVALLEGAPIDDWALYITHAVSYLAQYHSHPGPFLYILADQINRAARPYILAA